MLSSFEHAAIFQKVSWNCWGQLVTWHLMPTEMQTSYLREAGQSRNLWSRVIAIPSGTFSHQASPILFVWWGRSWPMWWWSGGAWGWPPHFWQPIGPADLAWWRRPMPPRWWLGSLCSRSPCSGRSHFLLKLSTDVWWEFLENVRIDLLRTRCCVINGGLCCCGQQWVGQYHMSRQGSLYWAVLRS